MTCKVMLLAAALIAAPVIAAQPMPAADQKLLSSYVPTMDNLGKYEAALAKVNDACQDDAALAAQTEDAAARPGETLEKAIARVAKTPVYMRYLKPAGLEPVDAILLPLVLTGAGAVVEMHADPSRLPGLSAQQVEFYRSHRAEIGKMELAADCDDESEDPQDAELLD
jgi:hypothetical protein